MTRKINRQNARSIAALQKALLDLLQEKDFDSISISEIADRSGLTRPTFYAHFDNKQALLESIINEILDEFFQQMAVIDDQRNGTAEDTESAKLFFRLWKEERELTEVLKSVDIDCMLLERLKHYWGKEYELLMDKGFPRTKPSLQQFLASFMAYAIVGILKEWIAQGMETPPEIMGEMAYHFTHPDTTLGAVEKFNAVLK